MCAYRYDTSESGNKDLVIDSWESGIALSPYKGIANIRNLNTGYYPGVAYVNYSRQLATQTNTGQFFAGTHSTNVSGNTGWVFTAPTGTGSMGIPIQKATSPSGLNYIQDSNGGIWKQDGVNVNSFTEIGSGGGRLENGNKGIAWWNNYLVVFGTGIIEFCGDGTGDAGIISTNWNLNTGSGLAINHSTFTTNYASASLIILPVVKSSLAKFRDSDPVTLTTTGTLPAGLSTNTTYFIANKIVGFPTSFGLSTSYANANLVLNAVPANGNTSFAMTTTWAGTTGTYTVMFSTGEQKSTTLTNGDNTFTTSALAFSYTGATTDLAVVVTLTSNGTGTHTITVTATPLPIGNCTSLLYSFVGGSSTGNPPYTSMTILSYVDPQGNTITGHWQEATGFWNIVMTGGQKVPALFVNGSSSVVFQSPLSYVQNGSDWQVQLLDPTVTFYRPYVSKVDGSLLFCNGQYIGRLLTSPDPNLTFAPSLALTYSVNFGATEIPEQFTDVVTGMTDLKASLVVTGRKDIYTWDYLSTSTTSPAPVGENIVDIINILNNIYVLAGQKGNIYVSNGYSAQLLYKIPDFIAGTIDPVWGFGGLMNHRSKLFFQALASTTSGTPILAGIFSLNVSATFLQAESASGLVMEAQNSFGLVPATTEARGVLMDNEPSSTGYDSYYSAWGCGAGSSGGIDFNDTTLWSNFEPVIETDMIPTGTNLEAMTFANVEYKLDRPLTSGDQIRLSFRTSLSDSYTMIGTGTTLKLSEKFISNIRDSQWVQFKAEFAAGGSSFIPLRELRLHLG